MVNQEIINIAMAYADTLKEELDIDSVYLFGSHVVRENSDSHIDIAVISKDFGENLVADRLLLLRMRRTVDLRIEPHPFNINAFTQANSFAKSIIETGIKII